MGKYLLLLVFVVAVIWWLRRDKAPRVQPPPATPPAETMTRCAHCGVHLPQAEAISDDGLHYCCVQHRRLGRRDA